MASKVFDERRSITLRDMSNDPPLSRANATRQFARRRPIRLQAARWLRAWIAGFAASLAMTAAVRWGFGERLDFAWLDALIASDPAKTAAARVKVVTAGDYDFRRLGIWPPPSLMPRRLLAKAVERLAAARAAAVCIDVRLGAARTPEDELLAKAIRTARAAGVEVIIAVTPSEPLPAGIANLATPASAIALRGPAGAIRYFDLGTSSPLAMPAAAYRVLRARGLTNQPLPRGRILVRMAFLDELAHYGLADLLAGVVPLQWLQDCVVFLGRADTFGADWHEIHTETGYRRAPGVMVQAACLATLLSKRPPPRISWLADACSAVGFAAIFAALFCFLPTWLASVLAVGIAILGGAAVGLWAFGTTGFVVSPTAPLAGVVAQTWLSTVRQRYLLARALGQFAGPHVLRRVAAMIEPRPGEGMLCELAALTFDVRSSSALAASVPPEVFGALLQDVLSRAADVVVAHGGVVNKYLGDGFLALFCRELGCAQPNASAVLAAVEAVQVAGAPSHQWQEAVGGPARCVATAHSGQAWLGFLGHPTRLEFAAIGETVNIAFELQRAAKQINAEVVVSQSTLPDTETLETEGWTRVAVEVRGRSERVDCLVKAGGVDDAKNGRRGVGSGDGGGRGDSGAN